jgi:hypothetical protein
MRITCDCPHSAPICRRRQRFPVAINASERSGNVEQRAEERRLVPGAAPHIEEQTCWRRQGGEDRGENRRHRRMKRRNIVHIHRKTDMYTLSL